MTRVRLVDVVKEYNGTLAVRGASFVIESGELFFLLGPSGCGKTTILRMIAGFIPPTRGQVLFNERDMTHVPPEARNAAMVFQSYALWPHMTVRQNVAFGLEVRKTPAAEAARRIEDALRSVHMDEYSGRKPSELSGGQQQRVALARALVVNPTVLLLDEPLSNLDAKLRVEMRQEIRRLCKSVGITSIYVTHDQKEAMSIGDRLAVLRDGNVIQIGSPKEMFDHPATAFVADFLGEANFIQAEVVSVDGGLMILNSAIGALQAGHFPIDLRPGRKVTCLIRPAAISLLHGPGLSSGQEPNLWRGRIHSCTYLGELAQLSVDCQSNLKMKVDLLNPDLLPVGTEVSLRATPKHVVVLPESR